MQGPTDDEPVPIVETTEEVCVFLNGRKGPRVDAFQKQGYFSYGDVVVCVEGKRAEVSARLRSETTTPGQLGAWVNR